MSLHYGDNIEETKKISSSETSPVNKYENLYDTALDLFCTITSDGLISNCNQSCADNLGYPKTELIGKSIFEITADDSTSILKSSLEDWKKTGISTNKQVFLKRKAQTTFPALINISNYYEDGVLVGGNTVIKDISEIYHEKPKPESGPQSNPNTEKERFLLKLTDEMRINLLELENYITNLSQERTIAINRVYLDGLNELKSKSSTLLRIILYLSDIQKIEKGEFVLTTSVCQLSDIINKVIAKLDPNIDSNGIIVTTNLSNDLYCSCDRKRITQVIETLMINAIDFCPSQNGTIDISLTREDNNAKIIVKDNGTGITMENQNKIFEQFYQLDLSIVRKHSEGGFGLPVCKGIVETHGGKIWAESQGLNTGAAIHITLPLTEQKSQTIRKIE